MDSSCCYLASRVTRKLIMRCMRSVLVRRARIAERGDQGDPHSSNACGLVTHSTAARAFEGSSVGIH